MVQFAKMRHVFVASVLASLWAWTTWAEEETEPTTPQGWLPALTTGSWYWDDVANWYQGEINGVFGPELVGSGKTYPTILFREDTNLPNGLKFNYTNSEQNTTLRGDESDVTLTLGGDVTVQIGGATSKGSLVIGSSAANMNAHLNLNGARKFNLENFSLRTYGRIYGGDLQITGDPSRVANLVLNGNSTVETDSQLVLTTGRGFYIKEQQDYLPGCLRARDVRIENGYLVYEGSIRQKTGTADRLEKLTLAPGSKGGMCRFQNYGNANYYNAHLSIGSLIREDETMLHFHVASGLLGAEGTGTQGSLLLTVDSGVETCGDGEFGTTTAPIVPWARGSLSASQTDNAAFSHLVTYDNERGFRLLDIETEQETLVPPYTNENMSVGANIRIRGAGTYDIRGDADVNSFVCGAGQGNALNVYATNGWIRVLTGVIDLSVYNNVYLTANLDCSGITAYITDVGNKRSYLRGSLKAKDVVFCNNFMSYDVGNAPIIVEASAEISRNAYLNGAVCMQSQNFLPHGDFTGDTYVNGKLQIFNGSLTINGLNGRGHVYFGQNYNSTFSIGDNDANGDFKGDFRVSSNPLSVIKLGTGRQRFAQGVNLQGKSSTGAFTCQGGTVISDGPIVASAITFADGTSFGGKGSFEAAATFQGSATLCVTPENGQLSCFTMNGLTIPEDASIRVELADGKWKGSQCILKNSESLEGVKFVRTANRNYSRFRLSDDKTELWLDPHQGFQLIIR